MSAGSEPVRAGAPLRWGGWALALGGVLTGAIFVYWMTQPDPGPDLAGAAVAAISPATLLSNAAYLAGLIALLLGLIGLHVSLSGGRTGRWATVGLFCGVAGVGLLLAALGTAALAPPVVADVYLAGQKGALDVLPPLSGGQFSPRILVYLGAAVLLSAIGAAASGVAIWRSGTLPRWAGVLFGLGFLLVAASVPVATTAGGLLLAVAGIWLARSVAHRAVAGAPAAADGVLPVASHPATS